MGEDEVKPAIQEGNRQFMAAFARGDTAGVAALYAVDAQLLPPHSNFVKGAGAIRNFWQGAIDMGILEAKLETIEVEAGGDTTIELGKYTLLLKDGRVADAGKYLVVWKQQGGAWKLYRDVWNTSQRAQ